MHRSVFMTCDLARRLVFCYVDRGAGRDHFHDV